MASGDGGVTADLDGGRIVIRGTYPGGVLQSWLQARRLGQRLLMLANQAERNEFVDEAGEE